MRQIHGGDIYRNDSCLDFSANINPFGMPASVREAAVKGIEASEHYPDCLCERLKEGIAEKEQVKKEQIVCTNGAAELLYAVCQAVKPKKALLAAPFFAEYEAALKSVDCEIKYYDLKKEKDFLLESDFISHLNEEIEILFLSNPNNPVGNLIDSWLLGQIAKKCEEKNIICVIDECFLEFCRNGEEKSMAVHLEDYPHMLIVKAFTKLYAMPGLRLGYGICGEERLAEKIRDCMQAWNVSVPAQEAGIAALQEKEFVEKSVCFIEQERDFLRESLEAGLAERVYAGEANYLLFEAPKELYGALKEKGILIRDCKNYRGLQEGFYRIAVRSREENEQLLSVWRQLRNEKAW